MFVLAFLFVFPFMAYFFAPTFKLPYPIYLKGGGLLIVTYTSKEVLPNRVHLLIQDRLFRVIFFLSTFDIEKLRKFNISAVDTTRKNALK